MNKIQLILVISVVGFFSCKGPAASTSEVDSTNNQSEGVAASRVESKSQNLNDNKYSAIEDLNAEIEWLTIEEALELSKSEPRKFIVDVYTDWCGWCKKMDRETYENPKIAAYISRNYYAIKFNAEQRESIQLGDKLFKFNPNVGRRGTHELALRIMNFRASYPTTVFLDETFSVIQPIPGYLPPKNIEPILAYFATDSHKNKVSWEKFQQEFNSAL